MSEETNNIREALMNALFLLKSKATVAVCYDDNTVRRGMETLRASGFTAIPVITRSGDYVGCINEGDFLWYLYDHRGRHHGPSDGAGGQPELRASRRRQEQIHRDHHQAGHSRILLPP